MLRSVFFVGLGGAAGSIARYGVSLVVNKFWTTPFPLATFLINILGAFIIGILFGLSSRNQWLQGGGMLILATGFCGGFTTFSTFALENVSLIQKQNSATAILYTALSVIIGLLLCRLGITIVK